MKLFRTKRQTQMFSYRNHNIALHKTIFAMPCYTKLEKNCRSWLFFDKLCGFSLSSRTTFALSKLVLVQRLDKSRRLLKIENFKRQSHLFPQTPPQHKYISRLTLQNSLINPKGSNIVLFENQSQTINQG